MTDRVEAYADALLEVARGEERLARVSDELFLVARTIDGNDELRNTLTDEAIPAARRQGVVETLVGDAADPVTVNLVSMIVGGGRARQLTQIVDAFVSKAAAERDREVAEVRSAIPLDEGQRERLAAALGQATGKQIEVQVIIDPSVIGGLVVQVGDTVIDGTVKSKLERLRERL